MQPIASSGALERILRDLIATRAGASYFADRVWGVSLRYDLGGGHPLVTVPDFELSDGSRVGELLRSGRGLLLDFSSDPMPGEVADRWAGRIDYVVGGAKDQLGLRGPLGRPDGFVAWASDDGESDADIGAVATLWFGLSD